ncbi:MAG: tetratricopeptide repeat protein [Elusimicrobiota bacterium]|jgi:tetratricopeptide (TPR) repeat protein|nr:tetratricopeptide repeat protein [Elusimicrobiota bacterium]
MTNKFLTIFLCAVLAGCGGFAVKKKTSLDYLAIGEMYHKTGDLKKSLNNFNKAVETDANNIEAYASRGALLFDLGEYKDALSDFNIVIKFYPNRSEAYSAAGAALAALGDYIPAREKLLRALKLNPSNVYAISSLGGVYFSTQNYKAAIEEYTKAINLQPVVEFYFMRGAAYQKYGKQKEAETDFKAAGLKEENFPKF